MLSPRFPNMDVSHSLLFSCLIAESSPPKPGKGSGLKVVELEGPASELTSELTSAGPFESDISRL